MIDENIKKISERRLQWYNAIKEKELKDISVPPCSRWFSGKLVKIKRGEIEIEYHTRSEMDNSTGILHGGMMCGMIDNAIGFAVFCLGYERGITTIAIQVSFLGKVKIGEKVQVKAKIFREGKYVLHAIAKSYNSNGDVIARANSDLLISNSYVDYYKFRKTHD